MVEGNLLCAAGGHARYEPGKKVREQFFDVIPKEKRQKKQNRKRASQRI
ncbi:hypothetical protein LC724_27670 [Blautia sp. RD014234]|nr:hypothetical protein [Blautia parvula]